jgi:hypothetical protein
MDDSLKFAGVFDNARAELDCAAKKNYNLYHGQCADVVNRVMEGFQRGIWEGGEKRAGMQMKRRLV